MEDDRIEHIGSTAINGMSAKVISNILVGKDWKDLKRNAYSLFTLVLPLILATLIRQMGEVTDELGSLTINMSLVIAACFIQAALVSEEKEKNTLRGLLLSPATLTEIFVGKSILSALITIFVVVGSILLSGYQFPLSLVAIVAILFSLVFYLAIGTMIGLISRSVMETSIIGAPVLFIFTLSFMFKSISEHDLLLTLISYLPNEQVTMILIGLGKGAASVTVLGHLWTILAWTVGSVILSMIIFKQQRFDS